MRPDISNLVRQLTYPNLLDAPKTLNRPHLRGVDSDIVFIEHSKQEKELENVHESRDSGAKSSKQNEYVSCPNLPPFLFRSNVHR
jgi:hypothetical protein